MHTYEQSDISYLFLNAALWQSLLHTITVIITHFADEESEEERQFGPPCHPNDR